MSVKKHDFLPDFARFAPSTFNIKLVMRRDVHGLAKMAVESTESACNALLLIEETPTPVKR